MAITQVPLIGQTLDVTQAPILANFNTIDTGFTINHVSFGSADVGKHYKVTFPVQGVAPVFAAGEQGLYNLLNASTAQNELYVHRAGAALDIPFTASNQAGQGYTYLPSGLLIKWGFVSAQPASPNPISIDMSLAGGPDFNAIPFAIFVTPRSTSAVNFTFSCGVRANPPGPTFRIFEAYFANPTHNNTQIQWLAIGVGV